MKDRSYKSVTKIILAQAYGFSSHLTVIRHIDARLEKANLDTKKKNILAGYHEKKMFLPEQTEIIVEYILGKPQHPELLYIEKTVNG